MNSGKYPYKPASTAPANTINPNVQQCKRTLGVLQKKRKLQYFTEEFVSVIKEFITLISNKEETKKIVKLKKKVNEAPQLKQSISNNKVKDQEATQGKQTSVIEEPCKS